MSAFNDLIVEQPRGQKYSFAVRFTGIPKLFTDGLASWSSFDLAYDERPGTLVNRDMKFLFRSDPQSPLTTGEGITLELVDDGTDEIAQLFAPGYAGLETNLATEESPEGGVGITAMDGGFGDGTMYVVDSSGLEVGDDLYLGSLETVKITSISDQGFGASTELGVDRAQYGTLAREHRIADGTLGVKVTTSPTTFKNRIAEVFICPVDSLTGLLRTDEAAPIWAGPIANIKSPDERIQVQCTSLGSLLEAGWPAVLPAGRLGGNTPSMRMVPRNWTDGITIMYNDPVNDWSRATAVITGLGTYDSAGTFVFLGPMADAYYSVHYVFQVIQDSLNYFFTTTALAPFLDGFDRPFKNKLKLSVVESSPENYELRYSFWPGIDAAVVGQMNIVVVPFLDIGANYYPHQAGLRDLRFRLPRGSGTCQSDEDRTVSFNGMVRVSAQDTSIQVKADTRLYPFQPAWDVALATYGAFRSVGLARIQDGDKWELIEIHSANTDLNGITTLSVRRGVGGTMAQDWGAEPGRAGPTCVQLLYMSDNATDLFALGPGVGEYDHLAPAEVVLGLLASYEVWADRHEDRQLSSANGEMERGPDRLFGYRQGLAIPIRYIDYHGILDVFRRYASEPIRAFWVDEAGKGKDALAEFMKYYGMFFVTRRFERGGIPYFGLSVESIAQPLTTHYQHTITDSDRTGDTKVEIDFNERLTVNVVSYTPYFTGWGGSKPDGDPVFYYDEWSIEEYGAAKTLELKPTILDWMTEDTNGGTRTGREASYAVTFASACRWFSAFGNGNYTLAMECPAPVGWRFQMGDHVLINLTGPRDPLTGQRNLSSLPARVYRVENVYGERGGARIEFRCGYSKSAELVPCGRVTAIDLGAGTFTLDGNFFSSALDRSPFDFDRPPADADWFDPAVIGADIACRIWVEGDYLNTVMGINITVRSGNVLQGEDDLTAIKTRLDAGDRVLICYDTWLSGPGSDSQAFRQRFAYMCSAWTMKLGTDDPLKEYA